MHFDRARRAVLVVAALLALATQLTAQEQLNYVSRFFPGITGAGARAMGMGGAFIAIADDATAASWNPAGLAVLERPEVSLVGQPLSRATSHEPAYTFIYHAISTWGNGEGYEITSRSPADPYDKTASSRSFDFASVTVPFRVGSVKIVPQISRQRVVDLGFDGSYDVSGQGETTFEQFCPWESWCNYTSVSGPDPNTTAYTLESSGGIDVWALSLGASFTPKLYVGLAVDRWGGSATSSSENLYTTQSQDSRTQSTTDQATTQDFSGTSVHFGILVKPTPKINLGLVFRPGFGMKLRSQLDQEYHSGVDGSSSESNETRDGTLDWPRTIGAGVAVMPTDFLTLSADFTTTNWSKAIFNHTYDYTSHSYDAQGQPRGQPTQVHTADVHYLWPNLYDPDNRGTSWSPQQTNASQLRLGAEYVVKDPKVAGLVVLPLRAGLIRDGQMTMNAPDPSKVAFYGVTAGFGLVWKRGSLDVAWVHMSGKSQYGYEGPVSGVGTSYTSDMHYRSDGKTSFASNRVIVSTVVRF